MRTACTSETFGLQSILVELSRCSVGASALDGVIGGAGTLIGAIIGTVIVFGLREYLSTLVPWWQYVLGAVYVLTILYLPMGLMGSLPPSGSGGHHEAKTTTRRN